MLSIFQSESSLSKTGGLVTTNSSYHQIQPKSGLNLSIEIDNDNPVPDMLDRPLSDFCFKRWRPRNQARSRKQPSFKDNFDFIKWVWVGNVLRWLSKVYLPLLFWIHSREFREFILEPESKIYRYQNYQNRHILSCSGITGNKKKITGKEANLQFISIVRRHSPSILFAMLHANVYTNTSKPLPIYFVFNAFKKFNPFILYSLLRFCI